MPHLKEAELRVLLYIIRRTFGFKKNADPISFNQFLNGITAKDGRQLDNGCGIKSRTNLNKALKSLEAKGIITTHKERGEKGELLATTYALRFKTGDTKDSRSDKGSTEKAPGGSTERVPTTNSITTHRDLSLEYSKGIAQKRGNTRARGGESTTVRSTTNRERS
jgi:hypothetical protein